MASRTLPAVCDLGDAVGVGRPTSDDPLSAHLRPPRLCRGVGAWDDAELTLTILPAYRPVDWAVAQGYAANRDQLLDWMQSCALLYFVDKHGFARRRCPPTSPGQTPADPWWPACTAAVACGLADKGRDWK